MIRSLAIYSKWLAALAMWSAPAMLSAAQYAGVWEFTGGFNGGAGLTLPGGGASPALVVEGSTPSYSSSVTDDGGKTLNGVITTVGGTANRLRLTHGMAALGGSFVNQYSLLFDIYSPAASRSSWRCLFQTNPGNGSTNDGDYFIRGDTDKMGTSALGYSGSALPETAWKRVIITAELGSSFKVYVDGVLFHTHTSQGVDGRYSLEPQLLLFADNDSENAALNVGAVAIWRGALTDTEVATLGTAGSAIIVNQPPAITQGGATSIIAQVGGGAVASAVNATDANGDPITWSVLTAPTRGTLHLNTTTGGTCNFTYTPGGTYTGADSFVLRASDGLAASSITVSVTTPYPAPVALWEFDSAAVQPGLATIGTDLTLQGTITPTAGINANDGSLEIGVGSYFRATNPIGGNGGGSFSNRYTLMWDVYIPSGAAGQWKTLLQTATANNNDGDLFINTSGALGTTGGLGGYSGNTIVAGNWYRVILRVINGTTGGGTIWVNGSKVYTGTTSGGVDGRYGLENQLLLFADDDGEDTTIRVSNVALWNDALADAQILNLGSATGRITTLPPPTPNFPPVITEGAATTLNATVNATTQATFNATDGNNEPLTWNVSATPTGGVAQITASTSAQCTVAYTANPGFVGTDSFTVRVTDGKAQDTIVVTVNVQNAAPVIAEGDTFALNATKNGGAQTFTVHVNDPDNNPLSWSVSSVPDHGTAQITASSNTEATVSYTPATDFAGNDSFVVRVSDGAAADSIAVNVVVNDPVAQPRLTIVSAHGVATPQPGIYSHPRGTALTNSVTNEIGATTRHTCTGWAMVGDGPYTGTAATMNMTLTRDSTLTWLWKTEHRVEVATTGNGTVTVQSGWFTADRPLQITATAGPGMYFTGWTGDTAGCTIGGKNIVLPMNRPYATITANFATSADFSVIAFPDTQHYCWMTPPSDPGFSPARDLFKRQSQWVVDNRVPYNIKFMTHLGDIVDSVGSSSQWNVAVGAMNVLNNMTPYGLAPGNHDISNSSTTYLTNFGPNAGRWTDPGTGQRYTWARGWSPRGYSSYQILTLNGRDYMFMHLDCDTPDSDLAWAATVLSQNPRVLTMITTHSYLAETGGGGSAGTGNGQRGRVNVPYTNFSPDRNSAQDIFRTVVKPFNQVYMVICGHNFAQYNVTSLNDSGNIVHEVLVDYQTLPNGGNGFVRIMEFKPGENRIHSSTWSPYLGRYINQRQYSDDRAGMLDLNDLDGGEFDVTVNFDTRFNHNLVISSPYASVTPAVGSYSYEDGTPVAVSAQDLVNGQTRYRCMGWTLSGSQTASGTGNTATITMNGDAALVWNWASEYRLETQATGRGIVSVNPGWQAAHSAVAIQAQPDAGASFLRWSGDIAGCTVNGPSISVPMDRPRGPVTAEFTPLVPTFQVEIVSAYPSVNPAPASYAFEGGREASFTAEDYTLGGVRRICTGWTATGGLSGSGRTATFTVTGDTTFTWNWRTQYLLSTTVSGPGFISGGEAQWVDEGASVSVTATPSAGAGFTQWSGDTAAGTAAGQVFTVAAMSRPVGPLTAEFTLGRHVLNVVSAQPGATPAVGQYTFPHGTTVEFSAKPVVTGRTRTVPAGWAITGANPASGTTREDTFVLNADATLTWNWNTEMLLELAGGVEGAVLPGDAPGWKPAGSVVALQARPAALFEFARWAGDVPPGLTAPTLSVTMDQPRAIVADLTPRQAPGGTPHWWLERHGHVVAGDYAAAEEADADRDLLNARREFVFGTVDDDTNSWAHVASFSFDTATARAALSWPGQPHRLYSVWGAANPGGPFTSLRSGIPGVAPTTSAELTVDQPGPRFFQVRATLAPGGLLDADSPARSAGPAAGSLVRSMKLIPGGTFTMGADDASPTAKPTHPVQITGFFMDQFEVTRADWEAVIAWGNARGYDLVATRTFPSPGLDHPVVGVTWFEAAKWCNARSEMEGRVPAYYTDTALTQVYRAGDSDLAAAHVNWAGNGYRLPTEAEWERACRGGLEGKLYSWGDEDLLFRANHWQYLVEIGANEEPYPITRRVGYFDGTSIPAGSAPDMANGYGLYDMAGNAWEWVWDRDNTYSAVKEFDPKGPDTGDTRVTRGGSWWNNTADAANAHRYPFPPGGNDLLGTNGFRCVRAAGPNEQ